MFDESRFLSYGIGYIFLLDKEGDPHTTTDEPSAINRQSAQWSHHGHLHRLNGPALIRSDEYLCENPKLPKYEYWIYSQKIDVDSPEEFQRYVELLAFI